MTKLSLPPRPPSLVVIESVGSVVLTLFALLGNALILAAVYRNPCLRSPTNIFIAALAVSDLLNACIPGTLFTSTIISGKLVFSGFGCKISGFLVHYLTYVSMTTMVLTAVNRYFRIVKTKHYRKLFSFKRSLMILVVLWILVAVFVLYPKVVGQGEFSFNPILSFCAYRFASRGAETVFTALVVSIFVLFGFSLISVSYYRVSRVIRRHNNHVSHSLQGVSAREIQLTKILFTLVFAFAVCWLPTFGVILVIRLGLVGKASHLLGIAIPFLMKISSAVNPLIYGVMSPSFRQEFKQILLLKRVNRGAPVNELCDLRTTSQNRENEIPLEDLGAIRQCQAMPDCEV